jgi:hypothetical protein
MVLPPTTERVRRNTAAGVNERIDEAARRRVEAFAAADAAAQSEAIERRLAELDREWDIERILEANASTLALVGTILGAFLSPWYLLIPGVVTALLLLHALQGWCPPVPLFRRLGKRTQSEIERERYALKALRGDFRGLATLPPELRAPRAIAAVASGNGAASARA